MNGGLLSSDVAKSKMEEEMMKITKHTILKSFTAFAFAGTLLGSGIGVAQENQASPVTEADDAEILTRGPVHEAFAGTVSYNPEPGLIVDKQPPALIEEVPPEQQLDGENVTWSPRFPRARPDSIRSPSSARKPATPRPSSTVPARS